MKDLWDLKDFDEADARLGGGRRSRRAAGASSRERRQVHSEPKPETRNPRSRTKNLKPLTRNPKPEGVGFKVRGARCRFHSSGFAVQGLGVWRLEGGRRGRRATRASSRRGGSYILNPVFIIITNLLFIALNCNAETWKSVIKSSSEFYLVSG